VALDIIWSETLVHVGVLYRPIVDANSDGGGTPSESGYQVITAALQYLNYSTRNFSEPSAIGRILQPSIISVQWGFSTPDAPWQDGDLILDATPGGLLSGLAFRILGPPTQYDPMPAGIDESSFSMVELRQLPRVPAEIAALREGPLGPLVLIEAA
jgi:hypothetical protein